MKLYMVEITTHAVVVADDEDHAREVASDCRRDALSDDIDPQIEVVREVGDLHDLDDGWDGECIPYGGDGNTRITTLLTPNSGINAPGEARSQRGTSDVE